jgi:hypothetical protein
MTAMTTERPAGWLMREAQDTVDALLAGTTHKGSISVPKSARSQAIEALRTAIANRGEVCRGWHVNPGPPSPGGNRVQIIVTVRGGKKVQA